MLDVIRFYKVVHQQLILPRRDDACNLNKNKIFVFESVCEVEADNREAAIWQ